jgi:hypothetical protein
VNLLRIYLYLSSYGIQLRLLFAIYAQGNSGLLLIGFPMTEPFRFLSDACLLLKVIGLVMTYVLKERNESQSLFTITLCLSTI